MAQVQQKGSVVEVTGIAATVDMDAGAGVGANQYMITTIQCGGDTGAITAPFSQLGSLGSPDFTLIGVNINDGQVSSAMAYKKVVGGEKLITWPWQAVISWASMRVVERDDLFGFIDSAQVDLSDSVQTSISSGTVTPTPSIDYYGIAQHSMTQGNLMFDGAAFSNVFNILFGVGDVGVVGGSLVDKLSSAGVAVECTLSSTDTGCELIGRMALFAMEAVAPPPSFDESAVYDGSSIPPDSILHYKAGVHDGGFDEAVFSDSTIAMIADEFIDLRVRNLSDGSQGIITDNGIQTITAAMSGGSHNLWRNNNVMRVEADIEVGDIIQCEQYVEAGQNTVDIQWRIEFVGGGFSATYTQTITVFNNFPGTYEVTLSTDGTVFLDAAMPGIQNAQYSNVQETTVEGSVSVDKDTGTLYWLTTENESAERAEILAGQNQPITLVGTQNVFSTGLSPDTSYYTHFLAVNEFGEGNDIRTGGFRTLASVPGAPPVILLPTGVQTGVTTADGSVSTDTGEGTLFSLVSVNAVELAATIKAGDSQAVIQTGVQNVSATLLTGGTQYYYHFVHTDPDGDSNVVTSLPFTTQFAVAVLSNGQISVQDITISGSVDTDQIGGTMYYLVDTNAAEADPNVIINTGRSKPVNAATVPVSWGGLAEATTYFIHFVQVTSGNSNIIDTLSAMTGTAPAVPPTSNINDAILLVTGGPTINDGLARWYDMQMSEALRDAEYRFLIENGATPRTINDMWFELLTPTYGPGALNDMQLQYWLNGGVF